ncbi:DUF6249 domain-containing protein [Lentisalinibacter orientalis]|uniref:DUF6249 domain-containing protein n=1 Tax=Lentisalinibacter orientalis TaxID=2992241 RepID=UPI003862FCB5
MGDFDSEILVPITLFISIAVVFALAFMYRARQREQIQLTVRQAIDKGQELTPELLEKLGHTGAQPHSDLRRGVIAVAIGLGIGAFGIILGQEDAMRPLVAIGAIPLLIGVAYLGLWKFAGRDA